MKLVSWNVNGVRSIIRKGFWDWFHSYNFDVVSIQENKAHKEDVKSELEVLNYNLYWAQAKKKGYSGVSVWSRSDIFTKYKIGIGIKEFDDEGRTIVVEHEKFFLINGYFPNGREDHSRVKFKLKYSYSVLKLAEKLRKDTGKGIVICGDINTAHTETDLARPKQNKKNTGFLPEERKFIDTLISLGYEDALRLKDKSSDIYSWWSYRARAKVNNVGWRIDYFFVSEELKDLVTDCYHMRNQEGSDHCPIVLEINL